MVGGWARGPGGRKSPSRVQGQSSGREFGGQSPPEAEVSVHFVTFSCIKFWI